MKKVAFLIFCVSTLFFPNTSFAAKPQCYSSYNGFCQYSGKVKSLYVNSRGMILMGFENSVSNSDVQVAGFTISQGGHGTVDLNQTPEFAKLFYSTALAAQSQNKAVVVQMHTTSNGYLLIDRIWLQ